MPKRRRQGVPLVPPPNQTMSRKRARQVTTAFHQLTRGHATKMDAGSAVALDKAQVVAYQKASQVSTSFHSTSKWVLGYLSRNGWVYGIPVSEDEAEEETETTAAKEKCKSNSRKRRKERHPTRLLEIGAINTQLLDASQTRRQYLLNVRAIDLHAMDKRIEEADFLRLPLHDVKRNSEDGGYDVIVCSMVINCVPTPSARGEMMCRLYHFLRPGGLLFLTLPRTCLRLSPYMDAADFGQLLTDLGLAICETKESPKIAFFVCQRVVQRPWDGTRWTKLHRRHQGAKFTNDFSIVLNKESFDGPFC